MNLFQLGNFTLHSGKQSNWKIECNALTEEDWHTLGHMIATKVGKFQYAIGIPRGGKPLEDWLKLWATNKPGDPILIVDDVYTTGASFRNYLWSPTDIGYVVFARTKPTDPRIRVLFQMEE